MLGLGRKYCQADHTKAPAQAGEQTFRGSCAGVQWASAHLIWECNFSKCTALPLLSQVTHTVCRQLADCPSTYPCWSQHRASHCCAALLLSGVRALRNAAHGAVGPMSKSASRAVAESPTLLVCMTDPAARAMVAPEPGHINRAHVFPNTAAGVMHALRLPSTT